eukprot:359013-Chlamydomonas_euryale.AAC.7
MSTSTRQGWRPHPPLTRPHICASHTSPHECIPVAALAAPARRHRRCPAPGRQSAPRATPGSAPHLGRSHLAARSAPFARGRHVTAGRRRPSQSAESAARGWCVRLPCGMQARVGGEVGKDEREALAQQLEAAARPGLAVGASTAGLG